MQHNPTEMIDMLGKCFITGEKYLWNVNTDVVHVCVVACSDWLINLLSIHGRSDSQTCTCVWLWIPFHINVFCSVIISLISASVCVSLQTCLSVFFMFLHACWQPKKAFLKKSLTPCADQCSDREATLGVLIKLCYNSERSGADEQEKRWRWRGWQGGAGRWRRRNRRGSEQRERAPLSPLLSALLIPVILFDGIRFINN